VKNTAGLGLRLLYQQKSKNKLDSCSKTWKVVVSNQIFNIILHTSEH
jgi:hypothetical protein